MSSKFLSTIRAGLLAAALVGGVALTAKADPVIGGDLYANGGDVSVVFLGSDAGYTNLLFLNPDTSTVIFNGHLTPDNTSYYLGNFAAGTHLVFFIDNQQGNKWYTGDGSLNSDGIAHALVNDGYGQGWTYVGFEDLPGGGDFDYNDMNFKVSNVSVSVPENAATVSLMGLALLGMYGFARRFRRA